MKLRLAKKVLVAGMDPRRRSRRPSRGRFLRACRRVAQFLLRGGKMRLAIGLAGHQVRLPLGRVVG